MGEATRSTGKDSRRTSEARWCEGLGCAEDRPLPLRSCRNDTVMDAVLLRYAISHETGVIDIKLESLPITERESDGLRQLLGVDLDFRVRNSESRATVLVCRDVFGLSPA